MNLISMANPLKGAMKNNSRATSPIKELASAPDSPPLTHTQKRWLSRGLNQPGGKLPLFDEDGTKIKKRTILSCIKRGWAEPWFSNPLKPDWLVCRLTKAGRKKLRTA
jgi:hypothetical protein